VRRNTIWSVIFIINIHLIIISSIGKMDGWTDGWMDDKYVFFILELLLIVVIVVVCSSSSGDDDVVG